MRHKYYHKDLAIDTNTLREHLALEYARPNDKIAYMVQKGELTSLARGFYAYTQHPQKNKYINFHIANIIYGVSYISTYTALSYYGLIPESVYAITSSTTKRSKDIVNANGTFTYDTISDNVFEIGLNSISANDDCTFIMAGPEKALCDLIWTTPNLAINSYKAMIVFLEDDIRFDIDFFAEANVEIFEQCALYGPKPKLINYLVKLCKHA
jgi:hypothetical protein